MTWMQTASGRAFNLLDPTPGMVTLDDIALHLAALCRFTGATTTERRLGAKPVGRRVPCHYSVAQHSWLVAEYLADTGKPQWGLRGLLHDAHEAYTGDLSSPMKWAMSKGFLEGANAYRVIANRIQTTIETALGLGPVEPGEAEAVHLADLVLLATERRDVMAPSTDPRLTWPEHAPWSRRIEAGFAPWAAREVFLNRFERFARLAPSRPGAR